MRVIYDPILGHIRQSDFTPGSTTTVTSVGSGVSLVVGPSSIKSLIAGTNITIVNNGNDVTITSTGDDIIVVANYAALPAPGTVTGQFYWCSASQGTAWLPGSLGGTYYSSGLYYSNGVSWEFMAVPYQATQATVNAGIVTDQFVSPNTLKNATITVPGLTSGNTTTNANLTGPITSVGNTTSIASQTGIGTKFVVDTSPTLITPDIGAATGASLSVTGAIQAGTSFIGAEANSTATNRGYTINTRNVAVAFAVPTFRPTTSNTVIALDIMPNGSPSEGSGGFSWFDVCDADVLNNNNAVRTARVGITSTGAEFGSYLFNGGVQLPMLFTMSGTTFMTGTALGKVMLGTKTGTANYNLDIHQATAAACNIQFTNTNTGTANTDGLNVGIDATGNALILQRENLAIQFWTNSAQKATILGTGELIVGGTSSTLISTELLSVQRNANSATHIYCSNTTSGTAGKATLTAVITGGAGIAIEALSAAFTTSGMRVANTGVLISGLSGGLIIGSFASAVVGIYTNNTLRATFAAASGNVDFTGLVVTTLSSNADLYTRAFNANSGAAARALTQAHNGTYSAGIIVYGTGYTTAGLLVANLVSLDSGSNVGILYASRGGGKQWWTIGGTATADEYMRLTTVGLSIGTKADPTATLTLKAGTTAASTSPLKFISGTNMTVAEVGAVEFDGTRLYYTNSTPTRKTIATIDEANVWREVPGTPTRSSNTVITITDTANAGLYDLLLSRLTVLKWTDTGAIKQAMIVSATYAANTVTITIIGDVLAASATMSTFKYSIEKVKPFRFPIAGTIAAGTNLSVSEQPQVLMKLHGARATHGTAGTTNDTVYDINVAGTSVFTTKITVGTGATAGADFTANDGATCTEIQALTTDVDSVSTTAPIDAYIYLFMSPVYNQYLS